MSDSNLVTQLETVLSTLPLFDQTNVLWPTKIDDSFNPADGTTYLQPFHLPANSDLLTFDREQENIGIYQITILCPLDEYYNAMTLSDNIKGHYKSSNMTGVEVLEANRAAAIRGQSHWSIPISISYRSIY